MSAQRLGRSTRPRSKWRLSAGGITVVVLGYFVLTKLSASPTAPQRPDVVAERLMWDFGDVAAGPVLTARFQVANRGARRLVLNKKSQSCECATASSPTIIIPPGGQAEVVATLGTKGLSGRFAIDVLYATSDALHPRLTFRLLADIQSTDASISDDEPLEPMSPTVDGIASEREPQKTRHTTGPASAVAAF